MIPITVGALTAAVEGVLRQGSLQAEIDQVVIDSRKAGPGTLFVAFVGANRDGHDFVEDVARRGAVGAIVTKPVQISDERFTIIQVENPLIAIQSLANRERRDFTGPVIGVTGSNGKTTTKEMLAAVFGDSCLYTEANLNTELGLPLTILRRDIKHKSMVLEMGMRGLGQIRELCQIAEPTAGIITNIGQSHMELLGSQENIAIAKAELLEALPTAGVAALCTDDEWLRRVASKCRGRVVWYGSAVTNDAWSSDVRTTEKGTSFTAHVLGQHQEVQIPTFGQHNVNNALGALLLGVVHDVDIASAATRLQSMPTSAGRLRMIQGLHNRQIIDDCFNASPLSVKASLRVLKDLARGRQTVAVLGDMYELGDYAEIGHREVGAFVTESEISRLVTIGPYARWIADEAKARGNKQVVHFEDKASALDGLEDVIPHESIVLVKASRGAALEHVVAQLAPSATQLSH